MKNGDLLGRHLEINGSLKGGNIRGDLSEIQGRSLNESASCIPQ
jgi:hypothetical protein